MFGAAAAVAGTTAATPLTAAPSPASPAVRRFKLDYAPHFGMFREHAGTDLLDQIRFMHDEGFRSLEDNGMARRPPEQQQAIGDLLETLGMRMGVFVAHAEWRKPEMGCVTRSKQVRERVVSEMRKAVEVAKRCRGTWCTVVPGPFRNGVEFDYQTANVIDNLRAAAEVCEPAGLVMVLEPLNPWKNHPGMYLSKIPQAYLVCRGVDSSSCKVLNDLYHQQITEGNLIPNLDRAYSETGYFQVGDTPGRKEPGTGEINYRNVFRHLHQKGYAGIIGMEHGNSKPGKEGERAVIDAYAAADNF